MNSPNDADAGLLLESPPRRFSSVSISSINITVGASLRARLKSAVTSFSLSPIHLLSIVEAFMPMKVAPDSGFKKEIY